MACGVACQQPPKGWQLDLAPWWHPQWLATRVKAVGVLLRVWALVCLVVLPSPSLALFVVRLRLDVECTTPHKLFVGDESNGSGMPTLDNGLISTS